ncbi:RHS repeat-associated core domain-containing protein [Chryseobacterium vrystaatense]|uniref:RHS repeat-associated core domain-containing protein n=2 Tax=Chryseobacterium vrystaatense TaxID=307480 RepID=A0A1M5DXJ0_9FLAO|nr:RHS repeat-associated core domain-containing protein [Chryseobacterium vrystaatense]
MNHLKTGNAFFGQNTYKNYKFQEQELQETGFYSFKWRNYMPDVGRFFNIDPLSEKYAYQSHYNFSENRVIDGRELEGLEWQASRNLENKTVNLHLTYKPVNNTVGVLSNAQMSTLLQEREAQIVSSFGGKDADGNQVNITFTQSNKSTIAWEYNMGYDLSGVEKADKLGANEQDQVGVTTQGLTSKIEDTQNNRTQINVGLPINMEWSDEGQMNFENSKNRSDLAKTGAHEDGHVLGLKHTDSEVKKNPKSLIRESPVGTQISPNQRMQIIKLIENQQKKCSIMKIDNKIILLLILFLMNCSSVKSTYEKSLESDEKSGFVIRKLKLYSDQSIIYFTESFDNNLQIEVNKKIVYNKKIETIEQLGYAGSCVIENNKDVVITIDDKKQIKLNSEQLPKYKFIYIGKDKNHYKIEYTNIARSFL